MTWFEHLARQEEERNPSPPSLSEQIESQIPSNPYIEQSNFEANIKSGAITESDLRKTNFPQEQPVNLPLSDSSSVPINLSVGTISITLLLANDSRKQVIIVNRDTVTVYLALGQVPTPTAYHIALAPCSIADDGTGGIFISDIWSGSIQAITASGTGHVCVTELS